MSQTSRLALIALGTLTIGAVLIFILLGWFLERQDLVAQGLARPDFPYQRYTIDELEKMFPQTVNLNVPTTQTPEQTHGQFIDYLKKGDISAAVECCFRQGDWDKTKEFIQGVKDRGYYDMMVGDLSEIEKGMVFDNTATYVYSGTYQGEKVGNTIEFIKDRQGRWLIESF